MTLINDADGSGRGRVSPAFVCVSDIRTISQKPMQLGSPNLTQNCSTVRSGNSLILGSKGQRPRLRGISRYEVTNTVSSWVFAFLWVLAST